MRLQEAYYLINQCGNNIKLETNKVIKHKNIRENAMV